MTPVLAAAASAAAETDPTQLLLTYGPLGIFAALAVVAFRVIWKRANELLGSATSRAESAEAKYEAIVSKLVDQIVPVVTRSTDATAEVLSELAAMRRERR